MTKEQEELKARFLEFEVRDGVEVSAELKAVWKVLLDILEEIKRICEKYNLKWTLEGGSLLGAIRHGGFIPWDDDIDVVMPRKDYDRLVEVMPRELPAHLFMQTTATDVGFHIPHIMVRDSRTTGIDIAHVRRRKKFNMGLRVDVLALDGMPDTAWGRWLLSRLVVLFILCVPRDDNERIGGWWGAKHLIAKALFHLLGRKGVYFVRERLLRMCSMERHKYCGSLVARNFWHPHSIRECDWYRSYKKVPFEYIDVPVPVDAEKILTQQFGKWRIPVKGGSYHGVLISDPHTDYRTYLVRHYNYLEEDFNGAGQT